MYIKRMIAFIISKDKIKLKPTLNLIKIEQQLHQLNMFLDGLYEKKRTKEIIIAQEKLKEEENIIF